jgi:hypothetical protein
VFSNVKRAGKLKVSPSASRNTLGKLSKVPLFVVSGDEGDIGIESW